MTTTVFTAGHSNHEADRFLELMRTHDISRIVDVRSRPYSRSSRFNKPDLARLLCLSGLDYFFLGRQLGGFPEGHTFYRGDGTVDYERRAQAPDFWDGMRELELLARGRRTVILCAEEDPARCHRRLLITPALLRVGIAVVHVRGDGHLEPEPDLAREAPRQLDLFGERS